MKNENQEDRLKPHSYDGIQEYDKKLPNWWLFTLYATIAFAIGYWVYYQKTDMGLTQVEEFQLALASIETAKAEASAGAPAISNSSLWAMSKDPAVLEKGKATYMAMCLACHGPTLEGGVGVNLVDKEWVHGGEPMQVRQTIINGVPEKGMLAWLPILGEEKIAEVTAFILSHQEQP